MIKQLDLDLIYIYTKERFLKCKEDWEANFYAAETRGKRTGDAAGQEDERRAAPGLLAGPGGDDKPD
jgi:hypothetical protein